MKPTIALTLLSFVFFTGNVMAQYEPDIGNGEFLLAFRGIQDSSKEVSIQAFTTAYDSIFRVVTDASAYSEKFFLYAQYNACYDRERNGTNGTIFYGGYRLKFWQKNSDGTRTQLGSNMTIDFRDADYNNGLTHYAVQATGHKDFWALMDYDNTGNNPPGGTSGQATQYFRYGSGDAAYKSTALNTSIWELWNGRFNPDKTQNYSSFVNFTAAISNEQEIVPLNMKINGSIYPMDHNSRINWALGFQGTNVVAIAPTQAFFVPGWHCFKPYYYFSRWEGGALFDTVSSNYVQNQAVSRKAIYKPSAQRVTVSGQNSFAYANPLTYSASLAQGRSGSQAQYAWYIKYDYNGVWQSIGNTQSVSVTPNANASYSFDIKCYIRDFVDSVGVWSTPKRVNYAPPLTAFIIGPTSCITQFSTVTWAAEVSGGDGTYTYQWKKDNTVVGTGSSISLQVTGGFRLHLTVTSTYGTQTYSTYKDISTSGCGGGGGGGGGCPFVFVHTESGLVQDNNILNKSEFEDNVGVDIIDRYRLNVKPSLDNGQYRLSIQELNDDHSYFDGFRLYAVDHPEGTDIGITENNDIVLLYPSYVESASDARMKDQDLTSAITFKEAHGLRGQKSDTLRLRFSQDSERWTSLNTLRAGRKESVALVADYEDVTINALLPPKEFAASVSTEESSYSLSGRESSSRLILPIESIPDDMTIVWNRDYTVKDIGLTRVFYDGFVQRELPLAEAVHSQKGKIRRELSETDGKYGELLPAETITLAFNNNAPLRQGYVRDFVLETTGRYVVPGRETRTALKKTEEAGFIPTKFGLVGNYPNPFNPTTSIVYDIADRSDVKLSIFNSLGQLVREFNEGARSQGRYTLTWDGKNNDGKQVPSGVYIYQLTAGQFVQTKKMLLVK